LFCTQQRSDNRELYLDIVFDNKVSVMPKRYILQSLMGFLTVGRACLEFTHSWRDHRILLFYSNSTSLHKVNLLGLRIGQDTLQQSQPYRSIDRSVRMIFTAKRAFIAKPWCPLKSDVHWNPTSRFTNVTQHSVI
jgi:hypothetical protein